MNKQKEPNFPPETPMHKINLLNRSVSTLFAFSARPSGKMDLNWQDYHQSGGGAADVFVYIVGDSCSCRCIEGEKAWVLFTFSRVPPPTLLCFGTLKAYHPGFITCLSPGWVRGVEDLSM